MGKIVVIDQASRFRAIQAQIDQTCGTELDQMEHLVPEDGPKRDIFEKFRSNAEHNRQKLKEKA